MLIQMLGQSQTIQDIAVQDIAGEAIVVQRVVTGIVW